MVSMGTRKEAFRFLQKQDSRSVSDHDKDMFFKRL